MIKYNNVFKNVKMTTISLQTRIEKLIRIRNNFENMLEKILSTKKFGDEDENIIKELEDEIICKTKKINKLQDTVKNMNSFNKNVILGSSITKEVRQTNFGFKSGGKLSMTPEKWQRQTIIESTGTTCEKTNVRINLRTNSLEEKTRPNKDTNGFDYTENFDGMQKIENKLIYVNMKCIVGNGGSQTRSLREVYWFVEGQLNFLLNSKGNDTIYFANILDGDFCGEHMDKFHYLLTLDKFKNINKKIYIGDLKGYLVWIIDLKKNDF